MFSFCLNDGSFFAHRLLYNSIDILKQKCLGFSSHVQPI